MERNWMIELREARYATMTLAAKAARCTVDLLRIIEDGSVTAPGVAKRIGKAYGMTKDQISDITCAATVARRAREARMSKEDVTQDRVRGVFWG